MAMLRVGDGTDGDITISTSKNINTDLITGGRSYADGVAYRVNALGSNYATAAATPNGIVAGDQVILINTMGRPANYDNGGNYEVFTIDHLDGDDVYFTQPLTKDYGDNGGNGNLSSHPVMIQRIPNYNNVTIDSGAILSCTDCANGNDAINGLVVFKCKDTLNVTNGYISANSKGFGGGHYNVQASGWGYGYGNGSFGSQQVGGGGGYGTEGEGWGTNYSYGEADLSKLHVGSGGGGAKYSSWGKYNGGDGAGAIFVIAQTLIVSTGGFTANGENGQTGTSTGRPGGGSGGAILIHAGDVTFPNNSLVVDKGLVGGNVYQGDGGYGRIAIHYQSGTVGTHAITPYTETISMPYKFDGVVQGKALDFLRIYNATDGELLSTYSGIAEGAYEVDAPGEGPYDIIAKADDGDMLAYGNVTPREIA